MKLSRFRRTLIRQIDLREVREALGRCGHLNRAARHVLEQTARGMHSPAIDGHRTHPIQSAPCGRAFREPIFQANFEVQRGRQRGCGLYGPHVRRDQQPPHGGVVGSSRCQESPQLGGLALALSRERWVVAVDGGAAAMRGC